MTSVAPDPNGQPQQQQQQPQGGVQQQAVYTQPQPQYGQQQGAVMMAQPGALQIPAGMPMMGQPQQVQWMQRPAEIPGCPLGLEYLTQIDQLLVKQQLELLEMFTGWETSNKYKLKNSMGQQVYYAAEESDMCMRQCCGPSRGFKMHITDNAGQEVIRVKRDFKCMGGCQWCASLDCCAHEVKVEAPVGKTIGYVRQSKSICAPKFKIKDEDHKTVLKIEGPVCIIQGPCCRRDQEFVVYDKDKKREVGKISKQWSGLIKEMFTDADNFGVSFPMDLDVKLKAVMIGAVFLIDFMFFEQQGNQNMAY